MAIKKQKDLRRRIRLTEPRNRRGRPYRKLASFSELVGNKAYKEYVKQQRADEQEIAIRRAKLIPPAERSARVKWWNETGRFQ